MRTQETQLALQSIADYAIQSIKKVQETPVNEDLKGFAITKDMAKRDGYVQAMQNILKQVDLIRKGGE